MDSHLIDSQIFGRQWSTPESHAIFAEPARVARWLEVVVALAEAQGEVGIIPAGSARAIAALRDYPLDLAAIAEATRTTSHSTLGMIHVLQRLLPAEAAEHVYYGTTVQDVSDSAQVLELEEVATILWRDLWAIEGALLDLVETHRETPMVGRTHGQPGAPITFGFKAATWADETGRNLDRLRESRDRWRVGQLGGAVGVLAFFGSRALPLRAAYCRRLGLPEPAISWLTTRDRLAEFAHVVASLTTSLARIANEVYVLARSDIGELHEPVAATTVGSISMPHKRNPEVSEQVVTLSRLVRSLAGVLGDTMIGEHERDGRSWKTEWVVLPELCHYALAAAGMTRGLVTALEVDEARMRANLDASGSSSSERLLSVMSERLGKHQAQTTLQEAYRDSRTSGRPLAVVLEGQVKADELVELERVDTGAAAATADEVVSRARRRREQETASWR
jgi:adenylosuccinate lyase